MSKVSFRARALDATKPMAIFKADEIPDFATIHRSVPQMPTGMEKEEEMEHHLQRALSAQQVYGTSEALVIPIPEVDDICERYDKLYHEEFKQGKQYIHIQAFGMEQEIPDYDMDSEDEGWVTDQAKKMEISSLKFEEMMDRLEKGSGQQVVTLQEAKLLLKEDDDLIIAVYDYWLNKRLRLEHPLIMQVKMEKRRDGSTTNNPYVAFRRRSEKMLTRKEKKNDETSYEKMLKLRRDLHRAVTILELIKRREKSKKEMLQLTIEVLEKRYQIEDFSGSMLQEAEALRHKIPSTFIPPYAYGAGWGQGEEITVKKKREYRKRKHKQVLQPRENTTVQPSHYNDIDVLQTDVYSSEDDGMSPGMSPSDHEDENDPDGPFVFRRKKNCHYYAPILNRLGNWSWHSPDDGGLGEQKFRYNLMSLSQPQRCQGFCRRRVGRGGRILVDRAFTPWDDRLYRTDLTAQGSCSGATGDYVTYIRERNIPHFRPHSPTSEDPVLRGSSSLSLAEEEPEFNLESFQSHKEQLLQMQRAQQEQLLKQDSPDRDVSMNNGLDHSFSSQPTSRFTLDSASAKFAVSAVLNTSQLQSAKSGAITTTSTLSSSSPSSLSSTSVLSSTSSLLASATATATLASSVMVSAAGVVPSSTETVTNGPIINSKTTGLSTSPAATVLQLNFPLNNNSPHSSHPTTPSGLSSSLSSVLSTASQSSSSTSAFTPINSLSNKTVSVNSNLLKLSAANYRNATLDRSRQNHDDVNNHLTNNIHNIKREKVVALDAT